MENELQAVQIQTQSLKKEKTKTAFKPRIRLANRPLSREQVKMVMLAVDNLRDASLLALGFNTGLRVSEAVSFIQDNIDWQQGSIKIWDEKKNIYRWIYAPLETMNKLKQHINESKPAGKPVFDMSCKTLERIIQRWTAQAIGEARSWHTVRHTYVSLSNEANQNIGVVIQNTGDRPATILRYYTHLSPDYLRKAVEAKPVYIETTEAI